MTGDSRQSTLIYLHDRLIIIEELTIHFSLVVQKAIKAKRVDGNQVIYVSPNALC